MAIHTLNRMRSIFAITVCMASPYLAMSPQLQASEVQVGRYSMFSATPTVAQKDILATALTVQFPERIQTVGEAIRYLLQRSGYRLASAEAIGPDTVSLFALPLPAVHRSLGPMTLTRCIGNPRGAGVPPGSRSGPPADHLRAVRGRSERSPNDRNLHRKGGRTR